jgi:colanic acid/amylovoran biosynthesis glycosyltransferase
LILVLFTKSYPYDIAAEQTFLGHEIPHLVRSFDRVIVVPRMIKGNLLTVPSSVEIENGLAAFYRENAGIVSTTLNALGSPYFYQELRSKLHLLLQPFKLAKLVLFSGRAALVVEWANGWLGNHPELYEEEYFPYYWPLRRETLAIMDKLFLASYDGRDYFRNRYPEFNDLFETAHLGTEDPGFISNASTDNVFRIVSCAHILPLKRIDLLCEGIAHAAKVRPEQKFEWHHFGEGKDRQVLQRALTTLFPPNAKGNFHGYVPNRDIMNHYREKPVDVFVNLSTTEGGAPVSIQEAISCGVPVIATNVGGNPDIVSERNGILLSPNPTLEEVADTLLKMVEAPEMAHRMRKESRLVWEESYNADVNFQAFAEKLKAIRQN